MSPGSRCKTLVCKYMHLVLFDDDYFVCVLFKEDILFRIKKKLKENFYFEQNFEVKKTFLWVNNLNGFIMQLLGNCFNRGVLTK